MMAPEKWQKVIDGAYLVWSYFSKEQYLLQFWLKNGSQFFDKPMHTYAGVNPIKQTFPATNKFHSE